MTKKSPLAIVSALLMFPPWRRGCSAGGGSGTRARSQGLHLVRASSSRIQVQCRHGSQGRPPRAPDDSMGSPYTVMSTSTVTIRPSIHIGHWRGLQGSEQLGSSVVQRGPGRLVRPVAPSRCPQDRHMLASLEDKDGLDTMTSSHGSTSPRLTPQQNTRSRGRHGREDLSRIITGDTRPASPRSRGVVECVH